MAEFKTFIELGDRYRDEDTRFEGVADSITFTRDGCARVKLRALVSSVPVEHWFDEPRLTFIGPDAIGFGSNGMSVMIRDGKPTTPL